MTATRTPAAHPFQRIDPQPDASVANPDGQDTRPDPHPAVMTFQRRGPAVIQPLAGRLRETDVHRTG